MSDLRRVRILLVLCIATLACGVFTSRLSPTATAQASPTIPSQAATDTPALTATVEAAAQPSDTPAPTQAAAATDTPNALSQMPAPFTNLMNISQYFNPVGQPVQSWNGIPIMPQATAGQEFKPGTVYSYKATATISGAADFYEAKLPALGFTSFTPGLAVGSSGTGSNASHNGFLYYLKGAQIILIYMNSYDSDPAHVIVVLSTQ